jgi:anti-sigma B factor antagonist
MTTRSQSPTRIEYASLTPHVVEVRISGEIGLGSVPSLDRLIRHLLESGNHRIVFNLQETAYIASAGIGCLIGAAEVAKERGGGVVLACVREKVRHVLEIMGLGKLIRFAADSVEATRLLAPGP